MVVDLNAAQNLVTVPTYASYAALIAALPAATAGRLAMVTSTDWERGMWVDTGSSWEPVARYAPENVSALPTGSEIGFRGQRVFLSSSAVARPRGLYHDEAGGWVHDGLGLANVLDYGALGDGTLHALSERYSTLALAQAAFPNAGVAALTDSIDWAAITEALARAYIVYLPPNYNYVLNRPICMPADTTLFSLGQNTQNHAATITCPSGYTYPNLIQNWAQASTTAAGEPNGVTANAYCSFYGINIDIASGASLYFPLYLGHLDANSRVEDISFDLEGCTISGAVIKFAGAPTGAQNFTVRNINVFHASGTNTVAQLIRTDIGNGLTLEKCNFTVAATNSGVTGTAAYINCDNGYCTIRDINFEGAVLDQIVLEINGMALHTVENCHFKCTAEGATAIKATGSDSYKPYVVKGCVFRLDGSSKVWKYVIDDAVTGATDRSIMPEGFCPTTRFTGEIYAIEYWDGQRGSLIGNGGTTYEDTRQAVQYFGSQKHCFVHQFASRDGGSYTAGDLIWSAVDNTLYRCTATGVVSEGAYNGATAYGVGRWVTQAGTVYRCIKPGTGQTPPNATYWESKGTALATFQAITLANLVPNYVYTSDNPTVVLTWTAGNYSRVGVLIEAVGIDTATEGTAKYMKAYYTLDRGALGAAPTAGDRSTADRHYYVLRGENITDDTETGRDFTMTLANPSGSTWTATMAFTDWENPYITIRVVEDSAGTVTLVQTA